MNSTTLSDGVVLDLGGGSMQLTRVGDRPAVDARSWPLGAVRMTERFAPGKKKRTEALREHVAAELASAVVARRGRAARRGRRHGRATSPRRRNSPPGMPSYGIQGYRVTRDALGALIEEFSSWPADAATCPASRPRAAT